MPVIIILVILLKQIFLNRFNDLILRLPRLIFSVRDYIVKIILKLCVYLYFDNEEYCKYKVVLKVGNPLSSLQIRNTDFMDVSIMFHDQFQENTRI